jgi:hypothetical protein
MSFLRHQEIYLPICPGRDPAGDRAPSHRLDEFPVGYSLAGCAPAEPTSASQTTPSMLWSDRKTKAFAANSILSLICMSHLRGAVHRACSCWCCAQITICAQKRTVDTVGLAPCIIYVQNVFMKYGYAHVSTDGQSVSAQVAALKQAGGGKVFREVARGAESNLAQLHRAIHALELGDVLVVSSENGRD